MEKSIKIPYILNGHKRFIYFKDIRGYKKICYSSNYGFIVLYKNGDKFYFFHMDGDEYILFSCQDNRGDVPVEYSDAEKFLDIKLI